MRISNQPISRKVNKLEDNTPAKLTLDKILADKRRVFASSKFDVGLMKNYEAHISLVVNKFISRKPYKCSYEDEKEIEKQIRELEKSELIEESSSPFASPVLLVFKKEEGKKI